MKRLFIFLMFLSVACEKNNNLQESSDITFTEVASVEIQGGYLAAEISAFEASSNRLYVTNNALANRIEVLELSNPEKPVVLDHILLDLPEGDTVLIHSLATVDQKLLVAASNVIPQRPGHVYIYNTGTFELDTTLQVGAMPDMIAVTPDGRFALTANEGEPDAAYVNDPVGSISIIALDSLDVSTVYFDECSHKKDSLLSHGFRIFGPGASFAQDIEPEYITISEDSKYAWVTLQENNGIAKIDILGKRLTDIFPLGFKDFRKPGNEIDICDNNEIKLNTWPIKGMYQPDAIAYYSVDQKRYLITANEGDGRDYTGYSEIVRVGDLALDENAFKHREQVKKCDSLGRLIVTNTLGDIDSDGDFDELYAFGTRSFSIWDAETGALLVDSQNTIEKDIIENSDFYDDNRSDDKGTEPEGIAVGVINGMPLAFIALERANAVVVYDISQPENLRFLQVLPTGIGPEGILLIDENDSPNGKPLLVISSEVDGKIKLYQP
ncbi:MAG: choice-of-anchor I family protein [Fulvivirga sp.]|nr:choice-of-anchor I family protein [Fulvivirga sp.]